MTMLPFLSVFDMCFVLSNVLVRYSQSQPVKRTSLLKACFVQEVEQIKTQFVLKCPVYFILNLR